jgi:hypothetical protein
MYVSYNNPHSDNILFLGGYGGNDNDGNMGSDTENMFLVGLPIVFHILNLLYSTFIIS